MGKLHRFEVVIAAAVLAGLATCGWAAPGDGIKISNLTLSPFVDLSATYDSNVHLTDPADADYFGDAVVGLAFINKTDRLTLSGRGWGQFRRYLDATDLDSDGYGEKLGLIWGEKEKLTLAVNEKFIQLEDYELTPRSVDSLNDVSANLMLTEDRTERTKRHLFDIAPVLGYDFTEKLHSEAGYSYSSVDYDDSDLYDWHENRGRLELQREVTDKSSGVLSGEYSQQDSDGLPDSTSYYVVQGGWLYRATAKTSAKIGLGLESFDYPKKSEYGESLDKDIFSWDVAASWQATEKINVQASGRNDIQPATQYKANVKEVSLGSVGVSYDITPTWIFSLAGSYRRDDYIGKVQVGDELLSKRRNIAGARARIDYRPRAKWYEVYLEASYEKARDNLEDDYPDYNQFRATLGLALRY